MNIAFNVSNLCANRADGITRYTNEMAARLPNLSPQHQWQFLAPCPKPDSYHPPLSTNTAWHTSRWPKYWTHTRLPLTLSRLQPDVLFMPIQQIPYLLPRRTKTVAVVHDLAIHKYPEQFTRHDLLLLHIFSAYVARHADYIIADSHSTANDITQYYGRTANLSVVHLGIDHQQFYPPNHSQKKDSWQELTTSIAGLTSPYLLYVGQLQPRKNLTRLISAFERVQIGNKKLKLVIAGSHGWLQKPIFKRIKTSPIRDRILLTGRVSDTILRSLYWHAKVFTLPSLYEGFGIPVLEAFACGCPVVTSNVSSLPEITGTAAVLVNPTDINSIAAGITEAILQPEKYAVAGLKQAKKFNWDLTAQNTQDIILSAAGKQYKVT